MTREGTKDAAEAVLRELPSVIGAYVREDVHGHPREVHLLVRSGPNPRLLAYDVRELLEERLGVPVDQRVISIAQLADGRRPGPLLSERAGMGSVRPLLDAAVAAGADLSGDAAAPDTPAPGHEPRLRFESIRTESMGNRVRVLVTLGHGDEVLAGEANGLDTGPGRLRAAAAATLQAVNHSCVGRARFEVEQTATVQAFDREYVLVGVLGSSPYLGRRPVSLTGAQPVDLDAESAAALATLKAVNRTLSLVLRLPDSAASRPPRSGRSRRS
jgi:hypothetical protein